MKVSASTIVVVWVVGSVIVIVAVVVVVHSHASSIELRRRTMIMHWSPGASIHSTTRRRRNETRPRPTPLSRFFVVEKRNPRTLVRVFLPSIGKGRNHGIVLSAGANKGLLCRGKTHFPLLPVYNVLLVMQLEILPEFPSSALLFSPGGTIVR